MDKNHIFEQGPIRPPSEAYSLLLRVTRNCPWNRCEFCPVYKGEKFSRRDVSEVLSDISAMRSWEDELKTLSWRFGFGGRLGYGELEYIWNSSGANPYLRALILFHLGGAKTAFIQDADSLVIKSDELSRILRSFRESFPTIERVTSYSRQRTIAKKSVEELKEIREAGLDRLHLGLESGSEKVLEFMHKGATNEEQIKAGINAKEAGFELSEYVMPGLGGTEFTREHAIETALVLNEINPDFIRLRTLAVPPRSPLYEKLAKGEFQLLNDLEIAKELKLFLENLNVRGSYLVSDHILNLLPELEGRFPEDKERLISTVEKFLSFSEEDQLSFIIGRRLGILEKLEQMEDEQKRSELFSIKRRLGLYDIASVQRLVEEVVKNFI